MNYDMKPMTDKMLAFGKLVASGVRPVDAYEQAYGVSRKTAGQNAARCLAKPVMRQFMEQLLAETREEVLPLREEVRDFLTRTMRDTAQEMPDRLRAAKQLAELEGFAVQRVEVETDTTFRAAIVAGAEREGMVRGE